MKTKRVSRPVENIDFIEQQAPRKSMRLPTYEEYLANPSMTPWTVELGNLLSHYRQRSIQEIGHRQ